MPIQEMVNMLKARMIKNAMNMRKMFSRHLFQFQQECRITSYLKNANMTFPYFLCKFTTMFGLGKNGLIVSLSRCKDSGGLYRGF